jgi:hypothetical protein
VDEVDAWHFEADFYSNEFLQHDTPFPGAAEKLKQIAELADLAYLTGRQDTSTDSMKQGTLASLEKHGFPLPSAGVYLFMARDRTPEMTGYKNGIIEGLQSQGRSIIAGIGDLPSDAKIYRRYFIPAYIFRGGKSRHLESEYTKHGPIVFFDSWPRLEIPISKI